MTGDHVGGFPLKNNSRGASDNIGKTELLVNKFGKGGILSIAKGEKGKK